MKNWLTQMFGFSKRELNGLVFLLFLIFLCTIFPALYDVYINEYSSPATSENIALQKLTLVDRYAKRNYEDNNFDLDRSSKKRAAHYFKFDPNTITEKEWQEFGLSYKQAMSIVNYVKKGGKFRKPEDLKKMYTISPEKFVALSPYINIQPTSNIAYAENTKHRFEKKAPIIVDINNADTLKLDEIKGIGPSFAKRIVKYRDRLGGFYEKEQLLEVFGLDTAKFLEIKDQVTIDVNSIKKININTAEFEDLKTHPYLKYKEMNAIVQYRKQHGSYKSTADLAKILILSKQTINKIAPYLAF